MSRKVDIFIGFVVGAIAGSAVMHFVESGKFDNKIDEIYEKEVKPARDEYLNKAKELIDKNKNIKEKMLDAYEDVNKELGYITNEAKEKVEEIKESIEEKVDSSVSLAKEMVEDIKETVVSKIQNNGPNVYFIGSNEYMDSEAYDSMSVVYHANGVVIDENYNPIDNFEDMIGKENYDKLAEMLDQRKEIVWIRNDDTSTDYEIQLADYDFND